MKFPISRCALLSTAARVLPTQGQRISCAAIVYAAGAIRDVENQCRKNPMISWQSCKEVSLTMTSASMHTAGCWKRPLLTLMYQLYIPGKVLELCLGLAVPISRPKMRQLFMSAMYAKRLQASLRAPHEETSNTYKDARLPRMFSISSAICSTKTLNNLLLQQSHLYQTTSAPEGIKQ